MSASTDTDRPPVFIYRGEGAHSWYYAVVDGFLAAFEGLGYETHDLIEGSAAQKLLAARVEQGLETWTVDINVRMIVPPGIGHIRKFSMIIDHPFLRTKDLANARPGDIVGLCDKSHLAAVTAIRSDLQPVFLPHAGPEPSVDNKPIADRDIDVLYAGSIPGEAGGVGWRTRNPGVPDAVAEIILEAGQAMAAGAVPVLTALREACLKRGKDLFSEFSPATLIEFVEQTELLAEEISRSAMLLALRDLPLHVVAPGLPDYLTPTPSAWTFHGERDADALIEMMGNTKIVLNPAVKFPYGAHDRVFHAQSRGAAVATPFSHFLDQDFDHGDSIVFADPVGDGPGFASILRDLLADDARLSALAAQGRDIYTDKHTWRRRAQTIVEAFRTLAA